MIKSYSLKALQTALNHALALDESSHEKMIALQGKVLKLIIAPLNVSFYMTFTPKLTLLADYTHEPDTIIRSNPLGLIRLSLLPASKARSIFNDNIQISGDVIFGHGVKVLFDGLDIDWEGHLAGFTGDVVAHQIGNMFRKGRALTQRFSYSMQANISNYLHDECRLFPFAEELNDFFNDVDELSLAVERLQAQIEIMAAHHEND